MPESFLVVAAAAFLLTVNALRPVPGTWFAVPAFFAAWLTSELAPHHLAGYSIIAGVFVARGGAVGAEGTIALVLSAFTVAGLVAMIVQAYRVRDVVERALCEALGQDYASCILPARADGHNLRVPWRQIFLPFRMSHSQVERIRNIRYGEAGRRNMLDIFRRRSVPDRSPVLLYVHGGGWTISNKNQQAKPLLLYMASRGWLCVTINYRLSPRATFPDHLVDCKRALAWVRDNAPSYGGDPSFVVVCGGSAGAHLAALTALTPNETGFQPGFEDADTTVQACVPYYGVYDFTDDSGLAMARRRARFLERIVMKTTLARGREAFERASPIHHLKGDIPPFFVIHGRNDSLVPVAETRRFVERLREASSQPVVYAELPGAQHAFDVFPSIRTAHVIRAAERFADYAYSVGSARRASHG